MSKEVWEAHLAPFLRNNVGAEVVIPEEGPSMGRPAVYHPWGDETLAVFLPEDECTNKIQALNAVHFPPQFSAVYHLDRGELEVLWTAFKLGKNTEEVAGREFTFVWKGTEIACCFADSSERLLALATIIHPVRAPSNTNHRNTNSYRIFSENAFPELVDKPRSFFVRGFDFQNEESEDFIKHLNAYLSYYDRRSPLILLHSTTEGDEGEYKALDRYVEGRFPEHIRADEIDTNLLSYWNEVASTSDQIMKFLLCYRMIEYAAFSYMNHAAKAELKREMLSPSLHSDLDASVGRMVEVFVRHTKETEAIHRTQNVVTAAVDLNLLWGAIECNQSFFSEDVEFDGGFVVKALMAKKCGFDNWQPNGVRNTLDRLRGIRNALAHGQDGSTRGTIQPTRANTLRLVPWVNVIEIIAGEVMLRHKAM